MHGDEREAKLAQALARSTSECAVCKDPTIAIAAISEASDPGEPQRVTLLALCWTCVSIARMSPAARPPYFTLLASWL
jgi:hypothetical protein